MLLCTAGAFGYFTICFPTSHRMYTHRLLAPEHCDNAVDEQCELACCRAAAYYRSTSSQCPRPGTAPPASAVACAAAAADAEGSCFRARNSACGAATAAACVLAASGSPAGAAPAPLHTAPQALVAPQRPQQIKTSAALADGMPDMHSAPAVKHYTAQHATAQPPVSQRSSLQPPNSVAQLAGLFGGDDLDEPVDPFTLYGTAFKRFFIDKLDGEKVPFGPRWFSWSS